MPTTTAETGTDYGPNSAAVRAHLAELAGDDEFTHRLAETARTRREAASTGPSVLDHAVQQFVDQNACYQAATNTGRIDAYERAWDSAQELAKATGALVGRWHHLAACRAAVALVVADLATPASSTPPGEGPAGATSGGEVPDSEDQQPALATVHVQQMLAPWQVAHRVAAELNALARHIPGAQQLALTLLADDPTCPMDTLPALVGALLTEQVAPTRAVR